MIKPINQDEFLQGRIAFDAGERTFCPMEKTPSWVAGFEYESDLAFNRELEIMRRLRSFSFMPIPQDRPIILPQYETIRLQVLCRPVEMINLYI